MGKRSKKNKKLKEKLDKELFMKEMIQNHIKENPDAHRGIKDDGKLRCPLLSENIIIKDGMGSDNYMNRIEDTQGSLIVAIRSNNIGDLKKLTSHENETVRNSAKNRLEKVKAKDSE